MTNTKEARIETSTVCNYSCVFCPHSSPDFTRKKQIMNMDLFKDIISKLPKQINTITLSGMGEVCTDPGTIDKIKYCKEKGYTVNMLSNGSLLTSIMLHQIVEAGLDSLRLSIHAIDPIKYENITGATTNEYINAINTVDILSGFRNGMELIVTCDMIEVDEDIIKNIRNWFEKKVDLLEIWKTHNWSDWGNYRKGSTHKTTCGRPFNGPLQIQVDGTINMCCFDYDGKLTIGDLKTQTVDEVFSGEEYKNILSFHSGEFDYEPLLCEYCDQLYEIDESVVIYNSKYNSKERIGKVSTTYQEME